MSHKINLLTRFLAWLEMTFFPILQNCILAPLYSYNHQPQTALTLATNVTTCTKFEHTPKLN